jgi:selenide,water dikinase
MLAGGQEMMDRARASIIGGHSIDDPEPKMGYAVTGLVHPSHIWRNDTAKPGEIVFLTKPIGTGLIIKAIKDGTADRQTAEAAETMMATLNGPAQEAIRAAVGDPGACTDVTGFGLLGHLWELAAGSGVRIRLDSERVPVLPGARELAEQKAFPRGSLRNWEFVQEHVELDRVPGFREWLLADAVTSGGLLFTAPEESREELQSAFQERGLSLWEIGLVSPGAARVDLR